MITFFDVWNRLTVLGKLVLIMFFIGLITGLSMVFFPPSFDGQTDLQTNSVNYFNDINNLSNPKIFDSEIITILDRNIVLLEDDTGFFKNYVLAENGTLVFFVETNQNFSSGDLVRVRGFIDSSIGILRIKPSSIFSVNGSNELSLPFEVGEYFDASSFFGEKIVFRNVLIKDIITRNLGLSLYFLDIIAFLPKAINEEIYVNSSYNLEGVFIKNGDENIFFVFDIL